MARIELDERELALLADRIADAVFKRLTAKESGLHEPARGGRTAPVHGSPKTG